MRLKIMHVSVLFLVIISSQQLFGAEVDDESQHETFDASKDSDNSRINHIGLLVDMKSSVGKVVLNCVNMAVSDTNALTTDQRRSIILHPSDSKGKPFTALNATKYLLESIKVDAIIFAEMTSEASIMAILGENVNVPILSFTSIPSSASHPYFLQISEEENTQFKAIISLLEEFKWKNILLIHEHTDQDGMNILPHLLEQFQEKNIQIIYKNAIALCSSEGDDQIVEEFNKLKMTQTSVFVVHTSPSLASKIFKNAKRFGMMSEGYAWLVTSKTMDFLDSLDPLVIKSMEGVMGLKSYIPPSTKLQDFTFRWKIEHSKPNQQQMVLNTIGIRAYDTICSLAKAAANLSPYKSNLTNYGPMFLKRILKSEFIGLGGNFRFMKGKLVFQGYKVVNIIGKFERVVGFWTMENGFTKQLPFVNELHGRGLETIIWPGLSTNSPNGWKSQGSREILRIGVPVPYGFPDILRVQHDIQNKVTTLSGYCFDVFEAAIEGLGYDVPYEFIPFENGSYNDLIEQVYLKVFDAAIGDITITSNRSLYVDFTLPFTDLGVGTLVRLNHNQNRWFFVKPLDPELWTAEACFFILLGITVWVLEHPANEEFQGSPAQQIGTILWFSVSTLVYAHRERLRSNLSKFVMGVWLFVVFILASSYTAILSSILTVQQIQLAKGDSIGYHSSSLLGGAT